MLSTCIVNDGGGRRGLSSTTCLDEKWLKASDYVGRNEFVKYMVTTILQVGDSFLESKNGGASCKIVAKAGGGRVISAKKMFHV